MVVAQFLTSIVGVFFGTLLMQLYRVDYQYAVEAGDVPRQFVAKSNIYRELSTLVAQVLLMSVGVSYIVHPPDGSTVFDVFQFRQLCLLFITGITAWKPIKLLYDRKKLVVLLSK